MSETRKDTLTIFMYPWFAMGHFIPYLLTANKFAERGHKTFLIVPPNTQPKLSPLSLYPDHIKFIPISIPAVDGLPAHVETTNDTTIQDQDLLRHALDLTQPVIESLLCDLKPDFIFSDLKHWVPGLARRLQIKSVYYSVASPATMGFLFTEGMLTEDIINGPPGYPPSIKLHKHMARVFVWFQTAKERGSGITLQKRFLTAICESDAVGFKTCKEIEGEYCEFLENMLKKPILFAGPMVPKPEANLTLDQKWAEWLDKFKPRTVIFCAFGTEVVLKKDRLEELLLGFELTGLPFLIALRPPLGVDSIEEDLPHGFKERTKERGIVYGGWVPQQLILKLSSVGCFVTHCGYGSTWEGLMSECQLVVLPHAFDHCIQARLLSGVLKVGLEVEIGDEDGLFTKEGVHGAIMAAMADGSEAGKEVRRNHDKYREFLMREGLEDSYFDNFVTKLRTLLE
ncbi:UDP-glucuronosyl and UDP-glucosyl transferase [Handroanthus impetiginosus]|uniref:Glycosyltransferase n=1 Tax=Handroanthus impetiginosus TaxID=429701 RepID=A0A2G9GYR6_9LAMI|nr:UDP-glucuronosyl and UDP-glucosyl transferase [Handroanthus impetiginosus]